jgi:hypothetical protein
MPLQILGGEELRMTISRAGATVMDFVRDKVNLSQPSWSSSAERFL